MLTTSYSIGKIFANEQELVVRPRTNITSRRGVLYVHGAEGGGAGGAIEWMNIPSRWPVMRAVAGGALVVTADLGGNQTWGNDTVKARMSLARTFLLAQQGVSSGKIDILAQSAGAPAAVAWAADNPSLVNAIALMIPVINLTHVRDTSGYQANIDSAYGGTYTESANGAAHNPLTIALAGRLAGIKVQVWYGDSDTLCLPSYARQFIAAAMADGRPLSGGHAEETVGRIDAAALAAFLHADG